MAGAGHRGGWGGASDCLVREEHRVHVRFQDPALQSLPWCRKLLWGLLVPTVVSLLILLPMHFFGARAPETDLLNLAIHHLNVTRENSNPMISSPWLATGRITVVFKVETRISFFSHRYRSTFVSAFYNDTLLERESGYPFTKASRYSSSFEAKWYPNLTGNLMFSQKSLSESVGASMRREVQSGAVALRFTLDAYVQVETLAWHRPKWYNLSGVVNASLKHLDSVQEAGAVSKICTRSPDWTPRIT